MGLLLIFVAVKSNEHPTVMNENANNYCIILAGGVGSRLWPYSRRNMPKQFIDFFKLGRTLLQLTYDRFAAFLPAENIFVSTYKDYAPIVHEQLPQMGASNIIAEPVQLGTAPATALCAAYIKAVNPKANLIITPADQIIIRDDEFRKQVMRGFKFVSTTPNFLALGVKATSPETHYGYLQAGEQCKEGFACVKSFTEKPTLDFARFFVESGEFYWSTGLFLCNVNTALEAMRGNFDNLLELTQLLDKGASQDEMEACVLDRFPRNRYQSVDMLILEHNTNVHILPCTFGWRDVGSWEGFYQVAQKDGHGNVLMQPRTTLYNSHNNIIKTSPDKAVFVSDLDGYILIENNDAILVCKKDDTSQIRHIMTDAEMKYGPSIS